MAERAALYGYLYPVATERGSTGKRYSLFPDPVVTWLALAALSGFVGNLSYDLVKAAFRRITRKRRHLQVVSLGSTDPAKHTVVIVPEVHVRIT